MGAVAERGPATSRSARTAKVAIIYPWSDPSEMSKGNDLRTGLMAKVLAECSAEVRLLSVGSTCRNFDGVRGYCYSPKPGLRTWNRIVSLPFRAWLYVRTLGRSRGATFHLQMFYRFAFDPCFAARLRELVSWSDIVFVEYTFFAARVTRMAKWLGKKVVVTDHDVMADNVSNAKAGRYAHALVVKKETAAMKAADLAVSVSEDERLRFQELGVATICIPHGIDTRRVSVHPALGKEAWRSRLYESNGVRIAAEQVCLFVGSGIVPNKEAAAILERLSQNLEGSDIVVVLAGDCMPKARRGKLLALGRIDDGALDALYRLADLVVIPLLQGTGASLKTIEAMAYAKPILGTRVAFRGYPVVPGRDCLIDDDTSKYSSLIASALTDTQALAAMGERARRLAEQFDYRVTYSEYVRRTEKLLAAETTP